MNKRKIRESDKISHPIHRHLQLHETRDVHVFIMHETPTKVTVNRHRQKSDVASSISSATAEPLPMTCTRYHSLLRISPSLTLETLTSPDVNAHIQ